MLGSRPHHLMSTWPGPPPAAVSPQEAPGPSTITPRSLTGLLQGCPKVSLVRPVPTFSPTGPALGMPLFDTMGKAGPPGQTLCVCGLLWPRSGLHRDCSEARDRNIVTWNVGGWRGGCHGRCSRRTCILFPPWGAPDGSCGKRFFQTHRVPSSELANPQLLHEPCVPWTPPFPSYLGGPGLWGTRVQGPHRQPSRADGGGQKPGTSLPEL